MTTRRNLEIKARVSGLDTPLAAARALGARDEGLRRDVDTYFQVPTGRLKLRETDGQPEATLIFYRRPDLASSRYSDYMLAPVTDSASLKALLGAALGPVAVVAKRRHLLIYGSTRIHLDRVDGLGSFVELETVLRGQSESEARAEHDLVAAALGLDRAEIVPWSYVDLLLEANRTH